MLIRKCTLEDLPHLTRLYGQVVEYLEQTVNFPRWKPGVYPCEATIREAICQEEQYACIADGVFLGAFRLNHDPQGDVSGCNWSEVSGTPGVIHTLATSPTAYGQGIGKAMVDFCIHLCRQQGDPGIRIDVVPDNYPARHLYEAKGFRFVDEADLHRGLPDIPVFALYEYVF